VPHHTDDPAERARRMSVLQRTEATFEPLPFNTAAALTFGLVSAAVVVAGHKPRHRIVDLMIASIAITNRLPLLPPTPAISPAWTSSRQFPQRRGCDQPDAERTKDCMRRRLLLELEYYSSNTSEASPRTAESVGTPNGPCGFLSASSRRDSRSGVADRRHPLRRTGRPKPQSPSLCHPSWLVRRSKRLCGSGQGEHYALLETWLKCQSLRVKGALGGWCFSRVGDPGEVTGLG
jgi:hypothetical protein